MDENKKPKCYQPEPSGFCTYWTYVSKEGFEDGEPIDKCKRCKLCEMSYEKTT